MIKSRQNSIDLWNSTHARCHDTEPNPNTPTPAHYQTKNKFQIGAFSELIDIKEALEPELYTDIETTSDIEIMDEWEYGKLFASETSVFTPEDKPSEEPKDEMD